MCLRTRFLVSLMAVLVYKGWRDRQELKGMVSRRIIYHDEVRFAGPAETYNDVAPPGSVSAN